MDFALLILLLGAWWGIETVHRQDSSPIVILKTVHRQNWKQFTNTFKDRPSTEFGTYLQMKE